jgi:enoyl-CoA hydratase/carnithine racemase
MGACALLPRIVGQGRAAELLLTGRELLADEALGWGFFNRLCEPDALLAEARALARSLAEGPTFANAMTKHMLHTEWDMGVDQAVDAEAHAQAVCMQTADFAEAYAAFVERRPPRFN